MRTPQRQLTRRDINAAREKVGGHKVSRRAVAELVEHAVAVSLFHLRVNVEARVTELQHVGTRA